MTKPSWGPEMIIDKCYQALGGKKKKLMDPNITHVCFKKKKILDVKVRLNCWHTLWD